MKQSDPAGNRPNLHLVNVLFLGAFSLMILRLAESAIALVKYSLFSWAIKISSLHQRNARNLRHQQFHL
ncbi:MAG: hypothetical protein LDL41_09685 [Coleofasciculus sp. S288]|nr:hypothetical protein [Coleofasciculus sp. S288]